MLENCKFGLAVMYGGFCRSCHQAIIEPRYLGLSVVLRNLRISSAVCV